MALFRIDKFTGIREEVSSQDLSSLAVCENYDIIAGNKLQSRDGVSFFDNTYGVVQVPVEMAEDSPILKIINAGTHSFSDGGNTKSIDEIIVLRRDGKIALLRNDGWSWIKSLAGFHYWNAEIYGNISSYSVSRFRDLILITANKEQVTTSLPHIPRTVILYKKFSDGNYTFVSAGIRGYATVASFVPQTGGALGPLSWYWHRQFDFITFEGITYSITGAINTSNVLNNFLSSATNLTGLTAATINTPNVPTSLEHFPPVGIAEHTLKVYRTASAGSTHSLVHSIQLANPTTAITVATPVVAASAAIPLYSDSGEVSDDILPSSVTFAATCITDNGVAWSLDYKRKLLLQSKPGAIYSWPIQFELGLKNDVKCIAALGNYVLLFSENTLERVEGFLDTQGLGYTEIKGVSQTTGTRFQDGIVKVDNKLYFLDKTGVYVTDGFSVTAVNSVLSSILTTLTAYPNTVRGHYDAGVNRIYWVSSTGKCLVYHMEPEVPGFTVYATNDITISAIGSFVDNLEMGAPRKFSQTGHKVLVGTTTSVLGAFDPTLTYDEIIPGELAATPDKTNSIASMFKTNHMDFGSSTSLKWITKIFVLIRSLGTSFGIKIRSFNNGTLIGKDLANHAAENVENKFAVVKRYFPRKHLRAMYKAVEVGSGDSTMYPVGNVNNLLIYKDTVSNLIRVYYSSGTLNPTPTGNIRGQKILARGPANTYNDQAFQTIEPILDTGATNLNTNTTTAWSSAGTQGGHIKSFYQEFMIGTVVFNGLAFPNPGFRKYKTSGTAPVLDLDFHRNCGGKASGEVEGIYRYSPFGLASGIIFVFGSFLDFGGYNYIVALNEDGTINTTISDLLIFNGPVNGFVANPDNTTATHYFIGGSFTTFKGSACINFVKISVAGVLDTAFQTNMSSKLDFTTFTTKKVFICRQGTSIFHIVVTNGSEWRMLNVTQTATTGYSDVLFNGEIHGYFVSSTNKLYVVGAFTTIDGVPATHIAKLDRDLIRDDTFQTTIGTGPNGIVKGISMGAYNTLVVVGQFSSFNGTVTLARTVELTQEGAIHGNLHSNVASSVVGSPSAKAVGGFFNFLVLSYEAGDLPSRGVPTLVNPSFSITTMQPFVALNLSTRQYSIESLLLEGSMRGTTTQEWSVSGVTKVGRIQVDAIELTYDIMGNAYQDPKENGD
jgi:hypothetical protein